RHFLRGDATEGLALLPRFQLEHQGDLAETLRELFGVLVGAILLRLFGLAFLGEMLELAAGRLYGEAFRQAVVAGIAVGDVLDLTGPTEASYLRLEDDAHAGLGGGGRRVERCVLLAAPQLPFPGRHRCRDRHDP